MRTLYDASVLDTRRMPAKSEVMAAIDGMLAMLTQKSPTLDASQLVSSFNALLEQAKDQFRDSDTLRLIEPLGAGASAAVVAVRLSLMSRTIAGDAAASARAS
jgi:hypothetical protein